MLATTSPVLQMLNEQLDVMTLSPIERQLYESRMKLKSDITTISESQYYAGREEGIQQGKSLGLAEGKSLGLAEGKSLGLAEGKSLGLAEGKSLGLAEGKSLGLAEGSRQAKRETAKNLLSMGLSIENIVKATGLTVQEVERLQ